MKIIDAHLHYSKIESFKKTAKDLSKVDYSYQGLLESCKAYDIVAAVAMGLEEEASGSFPDASVPNPMTIDLDQRVPSNLFYCPGINPVEFVKGNPRVAMEKIEKTLQSNKVVGIKLYAGYYHYYVYDGIYDPIYDLARQYELPVVIHSGDTYSDRGLLKYAHPLAVDELAVKHRDINFVICHMGDPWVMETAELIAKNPNVYTDLSGLIVGDKKNVERMKHERLFMDHIQRGLVYGDHYEKVLFGTDWPLVAMGPYIEFVKDLVPKAFHEDVFYYNALKVFSRLKG